MKYEEIHRLARKNGWVVIRQSGSHVIYRKVAKTYPVPYHQGKEIGKGLERKIRKDMHLI
jgi:predicted RNA binding protein YcfA (HicA-like mRNA interferase family)